MSNIPDNLLYTSDHEWVSKGDDDSCLVGITDYAQDSLGDVTFVEVPSVGSNFSKGDVFGVVESVKAASDLFMPVSGEVLEINEALTDSPELVNHSPYGDGWLLKIKPESIDSLNDLLSSDQYKVEIG